jgi:hypothetical protein
VRLGELEPRPAGSHHGARSAPDCHYPTHLHEDARKGAERSGGTVEGAGRWQVNSTQLSSAAAAGSRKKA